MKLDRLFVWAGGAMFVLSLAASVYVYVVPWAREPADAGRRWRAVAIDAALFTVFALHHSVFARESVKARLARVVPEHLLRSVYVWTAGVLLLAVLALWQRVTGDLYHVTGWRAIVHTAIQLSGIWIIALSVAKIDPLELAGIRPARDRGPLQVSGPYRWVRHPVYLGWALAVFGAAHLTGDRLAFAAMTTGYLVLAIPWEERALARAFGEQYARYKERVRWRVLPYVY